jgi:hypothetical protein
MVIYSNVAYHSNQFDKIIRLTKLNPLSMSGIFYYNKNSSGNGCLTNLNPFGISNFLYP